MALITKNFVVNNITNGKINSSGRHHNPQLILSQNYIIQNNTTIYGAPHSITNGYLYSIAHFSNSFIKIIKDFSVNNKQNTIYIPENILRFTYLGSNDSNSLLYAFSNTTNVDIYSIKFNILIANSIAHILGDYFDVVVPDYPNVYLIIIVSNNSWINKNIINDNICNFNITDFYCINPSFSSIDNGLSHFVMINGSNTILGINSTISIGCETFNFNSINCTNSYNGLKFSLSSMFVNETFTNDNLINIPTCYAFNSKILCLINDVESYVNVQDLQINYLVKTLNNGYKKILFINHDFVINNNQPSKFQSQIFKLSTIYGDLLVTGGHSILVDELNNEQYHKSISIFGEIKKIQNKYRLLSCLSNDFTHVQDDFRYNIVHFSLGDEEIIYANGVLSETLDLNWYLYEFKKI